MSDIHVDWEIKVKGGVSAIVRDTNLHIKSTELLKRGYSDAMMEELPKLFLWMWLKPSPELVSRSVKSWGSFRQASALCDDLFTTEIVRKYTDFEIAKRSARELLEAMDDEGLKLMIKKLHEMMRKWKDLQKDLLANFEARHHEDGVVDGSEPLLPIQFGLPRHFPAVPSPARPGDYTKEVLRTTGGVYQYGRIEGKIVYQLITPIMVCEL